MQDYHPEQFQRLIIKISGEFLAGEKGFGYDEAILDQLTEDIIDVAKAGYALGIVLGGGNFFRGKELAYIDRAAADNIGMLATIQNAIVVSETLKQKQVDTEIFSAFPIDKIARYFTYQDVDESLKKGKICLLSGGTGNPFFTTDTTAILRAIELKANLVLKGTKVNGIYTADPKKDPQAQFINEITYTEALHKQLNVMDMTAFSLARDYHMPIKVFNITQPGNIKNAVLYRGEGTLVWE